MIDQYLYVELMNKQSFPYALCVQKTALNKIEEEYSYARYWETGGILFGKISRSRKTVYIEKAEPIKGKKRFSLAYIRDGKSMSASDDDAGSIPSMFRLSPIPFR